MKTNGLKVAVSTELLRAQAKMESQMKKINLKLWLAIFTTIFTFSIFNTIALAETPDGATPANEGVCDELIGGSPGLYGLCVGFCEAQDCEATLNTSTGELILDSSCKESSPRLLENYNKRKGLDDVDMPCLNVVQGECPCWTPDELALVADGSTVNCPTADGTVLTIYGHDSINGKVENVKIKTGAFCIYNAYDSEGTLIKRQLGVTSEEAFNCRQSIVSECNARGN